MNWIDPACLLPVHGVLERLLPGVDGGADAMLMADGPEIAIPAQMSDAIAGAVKPGETVHIRGLKAHGADVILLVALETAGGDQITDPGVQAPAADRKEVRKAARSAGRPASETGTIARLLYSFRGELRGVLMEQGLTAALPRTLSEEQRHALVPGAQITLDGAVLDGPHGALMLTRKIGLPGGTSKPVRQGDKEAAKEARKAEARAARQAARKAARQATKTSDRAAARQTRQAEKKAERANKSEAERGID